MNELTKELWNHCAKMKCPSDGNFCLLCQCDYRDYYTACSYISGKTFIMTEEIL